jgi:hypothetical protein
VGGNFYNAEGLQRFFYYPETYAPGQGWAHWMPTVWFNGIDEQTGIWADISYTQSVYTSKISAIQPLPSSLALDFQVEYGDRADTGTVHVEVVAIDQILYTDLHLRLALIESDIPYGGKIYNQVLRDYLPDQNGLFLTIAQGDTFTHSEEFVIQSGWDPASCYIVAFVQNDAERMVLQSVQGRVFIPTPIVSETPVGGLPRHYWLRQNYPNPFNANTEICYRIPRAGHVTLRIFNSLGQEVRTLLDADQKADRYEITWDGRDNMGSEVASGLYFCRLKSGDFGKTIKMVLLR